MVSFNFNFFAEKKTENNLFTGTFAEFVDNAGYPQPFAKQEEMRNFAFGNGVRLLLGARGYGKSDYITILGNAYKIATEPNYSNFLITKEENRGKDLVKAIIEVLNKNKIELKTKSSNKITLPIQQGKEPALFMAPIGSSSYRGRHMTRAIMDDPITPDDINSPANRKRVKLVYEELTNLTPNITIIGQPVHKLDLYQELRKKVACMEVVHGDIPELDCDLEAKRLAGVSEESIQANYFLKIEGLKNMPFYDIERVNFFPNKKSVAFIDPSFKGGDYTAVSIGCMNFDKFVVVGFAYKKAWYDCIDNFVEIFRRFNVQRVAFETNSLGDEPIRVLQGLGCACVGINSSGNKHARIMNAGIHSDSLQLSNFSNKDYVDMVVSYEYGVEHDDPPDSLASLLMWIGLINRV